MAPTIFGIRSAQLLHLLIERQRPLCTLDRNSVFKVAACRFQTDRCEQGSVSVTLHQRQILRHRLPQPREQIVGRNRARRAELREKRPIASGQRDHVESGWREYRACASKRPGDDMAALFRIQVVRIDGFDKRRLRRVDEVTMHQGWSVPPAAGPCRRASSGSNARSPPCTGRRRRLRQGSDGANVIVGMCTAVGRRWGKQFNTVEHPNRGGQQAGERIE